jgi:hypothetical protein
MRGIFGHGIGQYIYLKNDVLNKHTTSALQIDITLRQQVHLDVAFFFLQKFNQYVDRILYPISRGHVGAGFEAGIANRP